MFNLKKKKKRTTLAVELRVNGRGQLEAWTGVRAIQQIQAKDDGEARVVMVPFREKETCG